MKIYIVGPVGSGKTRLAQEIEKIMHIPRYELDNIIHPNADIKRSTKEAISELGIILNKPDWIIEDVGRVCFGQGLLNAETVILLDYRLFFLLYRVTIRWIKQKLRIEPSNYAPSLRILINMYVWVIRYSVGKDGLRQRVKVFQDKLIVFRNPKQTRAFIKSLKETSYEKSRE